MKVAVIGAGTWGKNHIKTLLKMDMVSEVAVYDPCKQTQDELQQANTLRILTAMEAATDYDAVVIAAPTALHYTIGEFFITRSIPCLIEKPLAFKVTDAKALYQLAKDHNTLVMVGHIEQFNPAFRKLKQTIAQDHQATPITAIEVTREGMARQNFDTSVDVVYDLMIHDIELVNGLINAELVSTSAVHANVTDKLGHVSVLLRYQTGAIVKLTASRVSHKRSRIMSVHTIDANYEVDFIGKKLTKHLCDQHGYTTQSLEVHDNEPLKAELTHFLEAVKTGTNKVVTPAYDGYQAVAVAASIKQALTQELHSHCYE